MAKAVASTPSSTPPEAPAEVPLTLEALAARVGQLEQITAEQEQRLAAAAMVNQRLMRLGADLNARLYCHEVEANRRTDGRMDFGAGGLTFVSASVFTYQLYFERTSNWLVVGGEL
jgi:ribosomal protein L16/L10AE